MIFSQVSKELTQEKIFDLQRLLDNDLTNCEINWENLKLSAMSNVFPKQKKKKKTGLMKIVLILLKDKNFNRREIQQRVRMTKNDWFTRKASEEWRDIV